MNVGRIQSTAVTGPIHFPILLIVNNKQFKIGVEYIYLKINLEEISAYMAIKLCPFR